MANKVKNMTDLEDISSLNPFYTFDPFDCDNIDDLLIALESTDKNFKQFIEDNPKIETRILKQGVKSPIKRQEIPWDDANLIFIASTPTENRDLPPFGKGKSKERMGRIPLSEGNPISYLLLYLHPPNNKEGEKMFKLMSQLHSGFSKSIHGHENYSIGKWGMNLQGYLSNNDAETLHKLLKTLKWRVAASEPLDGGVRTFANDLSIILRDANKQKTGVLMRAHC